MTVATRDNVAGLGRSAGYGVLIEDHFFRLAVAPDRRVEVTTAPLEAPRVNTGVSAEDVTNEFGTRFSRADFSGGEGLLYAQRVDARPDDGTRYHDSQNVHVDDDGNVVLLHAPEVSDELTGTGVRLASASGSVWATNGTSLRRTDDPETTATWVDDDPHNGVAATTVTDVVGIGTTIYAAVGASVNRKVSGGSWTTWSSISGVERIWTAKGRLYLAIGNELHVEDISATPVDDIVLTIAPGETFNDFCDAGSHILVTSTDGYIHAIADDGSTVAVAGQTQRAGEVPYAIAAQDGVVLFGTSTPIEGTGATGRLYSAVLDGAVLSGIQRLRTFEGSSTVDRTPLVAEPHEDSIFVSVSESATVSSLWRYDLANGALHRSYRHDDAPTCRDVLSAAGRLWWGVDTVGVLRPSDSYWSSGWIVGPLGDLLTAQDKAWASIATSYSDLGGTGESITVKYTTGTALSTFSRATSYTFGDRTSEVTLADVTSRYIAVRIDLAPSSDGSTTPKLRSFSARAYPQTDEIIARFPVDVSDQVERPGKRRTSIRGLGNQTLATLSALEGRATTCELPQLQESLRGVVEQVSRPYVTTTRGGSQSSFAWVTFRGRRTTESVSTEGLVLMGSYFNGAGLMGSLPPMGDVA